MSKINNLYVLYTLSLMIWAAAFIPAAFYVDGLGQMYHEGFDYIFSFLWGTYPIVVFASVLSTYFYKWKNIQINIFYVIFLFIPIIWIGLGGIVFTLRQVLGIKIFYQWILP